MPLGNSIESALKIVGVTSERVERWIGRPCGCRERRDKLNAVEAWARRVVRGKVERAREYLEGLIAEETNP